jgi:hypothetical protein
MFVYRSKAYNANGGNDTFVAGTGPTTVAGGNGNNTLVVPQFGQGLKTTWNITGTNAGNVQVTNATNVGPINFTNVQNLGNGNNGSAGFVFAGSGSIAGKIVGGPANNTLDLSGATGASQLHLTRDGSLHGVQGTTNGVIGQGFDNFDSLVGSGKVTVDTLDPVTPGYQGNFNTAVTLQGFNSVNLHYTANFNGNLQAPSQSIQSLQVDGTMTGTGIINVGGNLTTLSVTGAVAGTATVVGNLTTASIGSLSGTLTVDGNFGAALVDASGTITGTTTATISGGFTGTVIVLGNLICATTLNGGLAGVFAVQGDVGVIQLDAKGLAVLTTVSTGSNATTKLTRFGGFTVNGGGVSASGRAVVLGNVFSDFTINGDLAGRVAVEGKGEFGLDGTLTSTDGKVTDNYTPANARIGMLGNVTVTGLTSGVLVCLGVIGDNSLEYSTNPQVRDSNTSGGTQLSVSITNSPNGIVMAGEHINGATSNAHGFAQDLAFAASGTPENANMNALRAIFTDQGINLLFNTISRGYTGLALILTDLGSLTVDSNGHLSGPVP